MTTGVSDEVWASLDPHAGSLPARTRRRVIAAALVAVVLLVGAATLHVEGLLQPVVATRPASEVAVHLDSHSFAARFTLRSDGWTNVDLRAVEAVPQRGLRFAGASGVPVNIPRGRSVTITVRAVVTDCRNPQVEDLPVRLRVRQWWGMTTVTVDVPIMPGPARMACGQGG